MGAGAWHQGAGFAQPYQESAGVTGRQTSRQATRQRTRKPSSQRGQVRGRLGNRNRKRNRRHGPINALKRSWRKANWPTRIKMVLIPTVAVVVVVALVAGLFVSQTGGHRFAQPRRHSWN